MATAFQADAFQNDAFQIDAGGGGGGSGSSPPAAPNTVQHFATESGGGRKLEHGIEDTLRAFGIERRKQREEQEIMQVLSWEAKTILDALKDIT
jgi:hypothetical protein